MSAFLKLKFDYLNMQHIFKTQIWQSEHVANV
jgi:hypothetical protein